jgi:hypothetical protein
MTAFMVTPNFTRMPASSSPTNARRRFSNESKLLEFVPGSELALYGAAARAARTSTGFAGATGTTSVTAPSTESSSIPLATSANDPITG